MFVFTSCDHVVVPYIVEEFSPVCTVILKLCDLEGGCGFEWEGDTMHQRVLYKLWWIVAEMSFLFSNLLKEWLIIIKKLELSNRPGYIIQNYLALFQTAKLLWNGGYIVLQMNCREATHERTS